MLTRPKSLKPALTLFAAIALAWLVFAGAFDIQAVQAWHRSWRDEVIAAPWLASFLFTAVYALATAISIPGATLLTLLGGAWFGTVWGTALVAIASTLGATGAMLMARTWLRSWVETRWSSRLNTIQEGIQRDGAWYLLTLRLIPIVPFFAVNLLMGITRMRVTTYAGVSALGMFPATVLYVNAGRQLADIQDLHGLIQPDIGASLAAIATLPWLIKGVMAWRQARKKWAPWRAQKPRHFDRNLVVLGGGAAGLVGAYMGSTLQAKVTLVEPHAMGGDCLNRGCVPSKALLHSAHLVRQSQAAQAQGLGTFERSADAFHRAMAHVRRSIEAIAPHDSAERYTALGVEVIAGHATLISPWHVRITPENAPAYTLSTRHVLLATGAEPVIPPIPGLDAQHCLTSDTLWDYLSACVQPPQSLAVIGAGPIGCELSQALSALGIEVHLFESAAQVLPQLDADVASVLERQLVADGVLLHTHASVQAIEHAQKTTLTWQQDGTLQRVEVDALLVATGRRARHAGLGLEKLGIQAHTFIEHNAYLQTRWPHIWVAGDAAGPMALTHAAAHQASTVALNTLLAPFWRRSAQAPWMPSAVYTQPEVAQAGLTLRAAQQLGLHVEEYTLPWTRSDRAITDVATEGFIRVITDTQRGQVLGVSIVGQHAASGLPLWVDAMRRRQSPAALLQTVHPYPTWNEGHKSLAGQWQLSKLTNTKRRVLAFVQRLKRGGQEPL